MRRLSRRHFLGTGLAAPAFAQRAYETPRGEVNHPGRNLLSGGHPAETLRSLLAPRDQWRPYPRRADRDKWLRLPQDQRRALLVKGLQHSGSTWPQILATDFLAYVRSGNRRTSDDARRERRTMLRNLVLGECARGDGQYVDPIIDGIWITCEESYWGSTAHLNMQQAGTGLPDVEEPTVDLFAADTASTLAWTDYLLGEVLDDVSPLIRRRIWNEVDRRVLTPCDERDDFWWMGLEEGGPGRALNNWTPWIDSNWLAASLLLERDEERRVRSVHRIMRSLDRFLESYHDDGGCDEGPSYWGRAGGSLFDCLELLRSASGGKIDVYHDPLVQEIGRYIVRAHIAGPWFVNFADASAKVTPDGGLVYFYGKRIGDEPMMQFGIWCNQELGGGGGDFRRRLMELFDVGSSISVEAAQPLLRDVWLPGIAMMAARTKSGSSEGLYVAAHGGHNAESHNHNDVGDFIVYADGEPAIIDVGVETYTAKTFSGERYDIWTMQSAWHNLPTIGGVMQAAGREYSATVKSHEAGDDAALLVLEIGEAWPADAGVQSWERSIRLDRSANELIIGDRYQLARAVPEITQTLMTPGPVEQTGPGTIRLAGVDVGYDPERLTPKIEAVTIDDPRLFSSWGRGIYRVLLVASGPPSSGGWELRIKQAG